MPFLFLLLFFVVGFVLTGPLAYLFSRRERGHLPMKAKYARRLSMLTWISAAIELLGAVMLLTGLRMPIGNIALGLLGVFLVFSSILVLFVGAIGLQIGLQVAWNPMAPRGRVFKRQPGDTDRIVEIWNVHPAFVTAAQAMYASRSPEPVESK